MRIPLYLIVCAGVNILAPEASTAQSDAQRLIVDASTATKDEKVDTISPGRYRLEAINLLPKGTYQLQWSIHTTAIDPFSIDALKGDTTLPPVPKLCEALDKAAKAVDAITEEKEVAAPLDHLRALHDGASSEEKRDCDNQLKTAADKLAHSRLVHGLEFALKPGQYLNVRLSRLESGGAAKQYKWRFVAPRTGAWITSFGLAAVFLPTGVADRPHFAKGDSGQFTLTPKARGTGLTGAPFVLYTWLPKPAGVAFPIISGGIGLDKASTPAVFLSSGLAVNSNLVVSFGAVLSQVTGLSGKYQSGEVIKSNLTEDQINEKAWRVRPFVGVTLRFATNPFKAAGTEVTSPAKDSTSAKSAKPAPAAGGTTP